MDKGGRTIVERNAVMEEMSNYFQELAKDNAIVIEEKGGKKSDERDEEIEDLTHVEERKIIDKFKMHKSPGIYGITTELIQRAAPT